MAESFTRTDMLPALPPPISQRGVVKWLRESMFSGWMNSFLSVLFALSIAYAAG